MSAIKLLTKFDAHKCLKAAYRAAQDQGFTLTPIDDRSTRFTASKGSALLNFIAGPLAPHCKFEISAASYADANELVIEMNSLRASSGSVGVNKVRKQAEDLIEAITAAIEKEGGMISERKDI